jgi:aminomethyltransferase
MLENVKRTALYEWHKKMGGKIVDFAGWALPIQYSGISQEHHAVRNQAGLFDVSHMGEVMVTGKDALAFAQYLVTNDVDTLEDTQVLYGMMCNEAGGVVDDLLVYRMEADRVLFVINASNVDKDYAWMKKCAQGFDVSLENQSDQTAQLAIQGPLAEEILQTLTETDLTGITFFHCREDVMIKGKTCLVSRTGYTGEDGFEVYCKPEDAADLATAILEAGSDKGLIPCGLGCRDTLRFEACLPLYGNEFDDTISPLEAGFGFFVKLDVEADFVGKAALKEQKDQGLTRRLVGFEMAKGISRHGYPVMDGDQEIGFVTTGYKSPTLGKSIGFAIVDMPYTDMGSTFEIKVRKKRMPATVVSKRFYRKNYKK